jgi:hypothetical protein
VSIDMGNVSSDTGSSSDIIQRKITDFLVQFKKKTKRLANPACNISVGSQWGVFLRRNGTCGAEDGYFCLCRGGGGETTCLEK